MASILLQRSLSGLSPIDEIGQEALRSIAIGDLIRVRMTKLRNPQHHRLFFALVNKVYENQDHYHNVEHFLTALKVALGHCDTVICKNGNTAYIPKSISFARMDQIEFDQFFNKAVDLICRDFLPGVKSDDLRREVLEMIGV